LSLNAVSASSRRSFRQRAEDSSLPHASAERGRRLFFSIGICVLAVLSAVILIAFGGITEKLIPLFAVGAFSAFTFSQAGMVLHCRQTCALVARTSRVIHGLGPVPSGLALL